MLFASIGLFGASGWYWYQNVLTNPERILSGMLDKSLQTTSVSRNVTQVGEGNNVNQSVYLSFTPDIKAQTITKLSEKTATATTTVTTETIGTPDADYVRYSAVDISGGDAKQNFDSVLNTWGANKATATGQAPAFLNDALFVIVPFGNLNSSQRVALKNEIRDVNLYKFQDSKIDFNNGRPYIDYNIGLTPKALVQVLAKYVEMTGVGNADELVPERYEGAPEIQVQLRVDLLSRHVRTIQFEGTGRLETYTGYNTKREVTLPTETITIDELQSRLTKIEQQ